MLVFRVKSSGQQNFLFIFVPLWPVSKLQAVYLFIFETSQSFEVIFCYYLKFAARIRIAHRELRVHITLGQPQLFLYRGSLIYTSMSTYHLLLIKL